MASSICNVTVRRTGRSCGRCANYLHPSSKVFVCGYHRTSRPHPPKKKQKECTDCPICMDTINSCDLEHTPCKHSFHRNCMIEWKKRSNTCPLCRAVIGTPPTPPTSLIDREQLLTIINDYPDFFYMVPFGDQTLVIFLANNDRYLI